MASKKKNVQKPEEKSAGRGGFRKGAGRKPKPEDERMISISFALLPELRDELDERTKLEGRGRSELLRRYSREGLDRKPKIKKTKGTKSS